MKQTLLILVVLSLFHACHQAGDEARIQGKIIGLNKGTVYLKTFDNDTLLRIRDSVRVKGKPQFSLSLKGMEPQLAVLEIKERPGDYLLFFTDDTVMTIQTQLDKFGVAKYMEGGPNLRHWLKYRDILRQYNEQKIDLTKQAFEAAQKGDTSLLHQIERKNLSLEKRRKLYALQFSANPPFIPVKAYVAYTEFRHNPRALDSIYAKWPETLRESHYGRLAKSVIDKQNSSR